ncbi:uncharacterized protein BP01DRAFT_384282 [Aspergillus saccharolyticus JOP 1030-1]|uniref:Uncharacterized protein n=1 Tax=Aspergillus saccharolyticus JOP 1030-1 TaxID=1450539 RepID=A0A318Z8G5_9EURO|nr:hypothetical protein BP01DRAFT_384282 [Aspergillus saccharolyticus JOP 1030-1]PYH43625.1 hypothetical protein BP01DRAFT_384282 [Aspergillus saccharolyticus JOP 1030-1]
MPALDSSPDVDAEQAYNGYEIYYDLTNATVFWAKPDGHHGGIQESWVADKASAGYDQGDHLWCPDGGPLPRGDPAHLRRAGAAGRYDVAGRRRQRAGQHHLRRRHRPGLGQSGDVIEIALMGGWRTSEELEEAANARRASTEDEIRSLGADWKSWDDDLAEIRSVCY